MSAFHVRKAYLSTPARFQVGKMGLPPRFLFFRESSDARAAPILDAPKRGKPPFRLVIA